MQAPAASGSDDHRIRPDNHRTPGIQVFQRRSGCLPVFVQEQLNCRAELPNLDRAVSLFGVDESARTNFVAQGAHDLGAGVVPGGMHAFARGASAVDGAQGAIRFFVEHHAQ